jgi:hypothetical protein
MQEEASWVVSSVGVGSHWAKTSSMATPRIKPICQGGIACGLEERWVHIYLETRFYWNKKREIEKKGRKCIYTL